MNRAERRRQDRARKKAVGTDTTQLEVEMMQPWADVLMRIKLPQTILDAMYLIWTRMKQTENL